MKDWTSKNLDRTSTQNVPLAIDFNSDYNECKNVVTPFFALDENDNKQLVKSIDILSKSISYKDIGTANNVELKRGSTDEVLETYLSGMVIFFKPKFNNTDTATLKITGLEPKMVYKAGLPLVANDLKTEDLYIVIYNKTLDIFEIDNVTEVVSVASGDASVIFKVANGVDDDDMINRSQLDLLLNITDVIDNLTTATTNQAGSANQGRVLKGLIDTRTTTVSSNNTNLDTMQKIVDYIKSTKFKINNLGIADIDGLQTALNSKADSAHKHSATYYTKALHDGITNGKAPIGGSVVNVFSAKNAVSADSAITKGQLGGLSSKNMFPYIDADNPTVVVNPTNLGATWINTTSGEIFVCTDITANANHWLGTNGTPIIPATQV